MEPRWWVQKFLLAAIQDIPVFVLYHSIVLIFNNFNGFFWFNNSKHFHFLFPEVLPSLAVLPVFFKSFLLIHRWRLLLTRSGGNSIFSYFSIQQDFISFLSAEIALQKKKKQILLSVLNVGQHCMWRILHILTWNKMLKLRICIISTWPKDFS